MPTSRNILISYYIYTDLFKLDNSDEIGEYWFSKLNQSTSKKHFQVKKSQLQNPKNMIKVTSFYQLMSQSWHILISEGLNTVQATNFIFH